MNRLQEICIQDEVRKFAPILDEFVDKLQSFGVLRSDCSTLCMLSNGIRVYFGGQQVRDLTHKANAFHEIMDIVNDFQGKDSNEITKQGDE